MQTNLCVDCKRPISRRATRCRRCSKLGNGHARGHGGRPYDRMLAEATIARAAAAYRLTSDHLRATGRGALLSSARWLAALLLDAQGVPARQIAALLHRSEGRGGQLLATARKHYQADPAFRRTVDGLHKRAA